MPMFILAVVYKKSELKNIKIAREVTVSNNIKLQNYTILYEDI